MPTSEVNDDAPTPPSRRSRRRGGCLLLAAVVVVAAGVAGALWHSGTIDRWLSGDQTDVPVVPPGAVPVALYGDSLTTQAAPYFRIDVMAHGRGVVDVRAFPGTAICDWVHDMSRIAHRFHPRAVVVEFAGNNLTRCIRDPRTHQPLVGTALVSRYQADADRVMRVFDQPGTTVYFAAPPPARAGGLADLAGAIGQLYQAMPSRYPNARFVDAGQAVTDRGSYVDYLPCLPFETCLGPRLGGVLTNRVRSRDGIHFCPVDARPDGTCPVYSSGALRFAAAMALPVTTAFNL